MESFHSSRDSGQVRFSSAVLEPLATKSRLNLPFLIRVALSHAPEQLQNTFQNAFLTFAQVLLRQRQLSSTKYVCETRDIGGNDGCKFGDLLEDICINLNIEREQVDPDRVIWVGEETLSKFLIRPGQWVNLCKFSDGGTSGDCERARKKGSDEPHFTCKIVPMPKAMQEGQESVTTIVMNPVTEYNLRRALNILPFLPIPDLQLKPLVTDPVIKTTNKSLSFSPIQGKSVKLRRLKSCNEIDEVDCDILIRDIFLQNDKFLCVGDTISCPLQDGTSLDLIVSEINDKQLEHGCKELFRVSSISSKVVIDSHDYHDQFHVKASSDKVKRLLAPCLQQYFSKMLEGITQALIVGHAKTCSPDLWPNFLVFGPIGSGKTSVCRTVAAFYGFNFHFINGVNLIGDTSAYTEAKFRAVHDQVKNSLCPALVYIKNVHLVGKDKDGNEDKRVILAFKEFLIYMASLSLSPLDGSNPMSSRAVFVAGSTNFPDLLVSSVANNFLFKVEFPSSVNSLVETESTLKWLLQKADVGVEEGTELGAWIKENCEGMRKSYGDLKALVAGVVRCSFNRITKSDQKGISNKFAVNADDLNCGLKTIDAVLKKAASSVEIPKVSWEDIGGLEEIKRELISSVRLPLEYPHLFSSGIRRSGILLYGPPGTGKTLIAKAVATEFKLSFLSVKGPELLNMYVGQSEQNVRNVFDKARNSSPCIIFFDELDALAPSRGRAGDSGGVMDRVVSQILAELDGTHSTPDVFIIGATNRPDLIDPALLRPGRFDKLLYVGMNQDDSSKTSVLKALTRKFQFSEDVDLAKIASMLPNGMTGADLYSFCSDTYMTAVERRISDISVDKRGEDNTQDSVSSGVLVCMCDFENAIPRATTSLSGEELAKYEALKMIKR